MQDDWEELRKHIKESLAEPEEGQPFWIIIDDVTDGETESLYLVRSGDKYLLILYPTKETADNACTRIRKRIPGSRIRALGNRHLETILRAVEENRLDYSLALAVPGQDGRNILIEQKSPEDIRHMMIEYLNLKRYGII